MPDAFFHRDGYLDIPTELTRGPWSPQAPARRGRPALLATEMERTQARDDAMDVRTSFEFLNQSRSRRSHLDPGAERRPQRPVDRGRALVWR